MGRRLYVYDKELKKLVEVTQDYEPTPRVHVIGDEMPPTAHPGLPPGAPNRMFNSKSAFRRVTKELGLTEIGNEKLPKSKPYKPQMNVRDMWERAEADVKRRRGR